MAMPEPNANASMSSESKDQTQETFQKLKASCVPLLGHSSLSPATIPIVSKLLSDVISTLQESQKTGRVLSTSLISYVFFPVSTLLRRNPLPAIPDQILEKSLSLLAILCDTWWWDMDETTWEQIFMLSGAILGGMESKGKGRERDNETKYAAAQCLWSLLRVRLPEEDPIARAGLPSRSTQRVASLQAHVQSEKFIPVIGQTLNSLLVTAESQHRPLQKLALQILQVIIEAYLPDDFVPSVLPGVVSSACKIALGTRVAKGWTNGEIVAGAVAVLQAVVVRSIGDEVCAREGAVKPVNDLQDLVEISTQSETQQASTAPTSRYSTARTPAWLRGTASQLHIALNSLSPLVNHPTPVALLSLCTFSATVLSATVLTLPQSQPLLLSFLLSTSNSEVESVSRHAKQKLLKLLAPSSKTQHALLPVLLQISKDNLASLPRLLPSHSDSKVEHNARVIEAICNLGIEDVSQRPYNVISIGVGKLLGPNGGIERWGWALLSVLEFLTPPVTVAGASAAQLMLEANSEAANWMPFPEVTLRNVSSRSAHAALERMLRALGRAAGEDCLFAIEWFLSVGQSGKTQRAVAALWCACRLTEGVGRISLDADTLSANVGTRQPKRLEKFARGLARNIAELWDDEEEADLPQNPPEGVKDDLNDNALVERIEGLHSIRGAVGLKAERVGTITGNATTQPLLHQAFSLQLLSVASAILQARFTPLLLYTLYPVMHSLISPYSHLSTTALATLHYITNATSYASPANLLLSNFDYALDAVSRRLSRRWLDVDATKVLLVLVRLVGRDVVLKAGDVVEECFDRLDEYHGYEIIVDGLVAVLVEVVDVVGTDEENRFDHGARIDRAMSSPKDSDRFSAFCEWFAHRHDEAEKTEGADLGAFSDEPPKEDSGHQQADEATDPDVEPPPTPAQALTKQIVTRSMYFLTHGSPVIRARILTLLSSSVPVLPESALLPSIHQAWPYILNRFADSEPFVVSAAAGLVESLASHVGDFMYRRIWDDIWPRFKIQLGKLDAADAKSALARRGPGAVGTESAYTQSHRLYRAMLKTMTAAVKGVQAQDSAIWDMTVLCRRFLHNGAHEELQACARDLYRAVRLSNEDAVWFVLFATLGEIPSWTFLHETKWDIRQNAESILS